MKKKTKVTPENPSVTYFRSQLLMKINDLIKRKKFTQKEAAAVLEIDQPKVSALQNGKLSGFSLERLIKFLKRLGHQVEIDISPIARKH